MKQFYRRTIKERVLLALAIISLVSLVSLSGTFFILGMLDIILGFGAFWLMPAFICLIGLLPPTIIFFHFMNKISTKRKGSSFTAVRIFLTRDNLFFVDFSNKSWQVYTKHRLSKVYSFKTLTGLNIRCDEEVIYSTSSSMIKTLAGGVLFGGLGAVAGAISDNTRQKATTKRIYWIELEINDIYNAGMLLQANDEGVLRFIKTLELYYEKNHADMNLQQEKDNENVYNEQKEVKINSQFCVSCGKKINNANANFCASCGVAVSA